MLYAWGMRPTVGFRHTVPQHCEGQRMEPPRSLPSPMGLMPVASAAASPPLEPPGVRPGSHGLRVGPLRLESVCMRMAKSGRFVRPRGMAPAAFMRCTPGASSDGRAPARACTPWVVGLPVQSTFSFTVKGTPCNGPSGSPAARRRSASPAAIVASSTRTRVTAFTAGLTASIRARCASTTSRLDTSPAAMRAARWAAPCCQSSAAMVSPVPSSMRPPATSAWRAYAAGSIEGSNGTTRPRPRFLAS